MSKKKNKRNFITAEELDKKFDEGKEDVLQYFDKKTTRIVPPAIQRVNLDMPLWILRKVDKEAERVGVPRTSLLKLWIAQQADRLAG